MSSVRDFKHAKHITPSTIFALILYLCLMWNAPCDNKKHKKHFRALPLRSLFDGEK